MEAKQMKALRLVPKPSMVEEGDTPDAAAADEGAFFEEWLVQAREARDSGELVRLAFAHCHEMVYATAHRITGSRSDAEDVTQNVFETLIGDVTKIRDPARLPGYLKTMAVRSSLRIIRRRRWWSGRRAALLLADTQTEAPHDSVASATVRQLLDRLSAEERAVIVLKFVDQHTLEETANLVGASISTVQRRLASARKKVASLIEGDLQLAVLKRMGSS